MSKEQALAKMLKEMERNHSETEDRIHNWLCDQQDDTALMVGICEEDKSIAGALKYCKDKARNKAINGCAVIDDDTVFEWVYEYFVGKKNKKGKATPKSEPVKKESVKKDLEQMNLFDFDD